jgi:hypothetical protein
MPRTLISRICHKCNTYYRPSEHCNCGVNNSRMKDGPRLHVGTFKPYTEPNAPGAPTFETRAQRDAYCAQNKLTYDIKSNPKVVRKPLIDDKVVDSIMKRAQSGEKVELPPPPPDMDMERVIPIPTE